MASSQTSSFWLCPACSKHVPTRQTSCKCGFDRAAEKAAVPIVGPQPAVASKPQFQEAPEREPTPWKAIATVCVGAIVLAGAFKVSMDAGKQPDPKPSQMAGVLRDQPQTPSGPQAYFLQIPAGSQLTQQSGMQPTPRVLTPAEQVAMAARQLQQQKDEVRQQPLEPPIEDALRQQQALAQSQPEISESQLRQQQETAQRQQQQQWQMESAKMLAQLRETFTAYKYFICTELHGGIPLLSAPGDTRGQYLAALEAAQAFAESARAAGAREWVKIDFNEFPKPEEGRIEAHVGSPLLRKWNCPK